MRVSKIYSVKLVQRRATICGLLVAGLMMGASPLAAAETGHHRHHHEATRSDDTEQRIKHLHASLQITESEEANWAVVAQAIRAKNANMHSLMVEQKAEHKTNRTAVEDMQARLNFDQAHVEGLKALQGAFVALYNAMPETQQRHADEVFKHLMHNRMHDRG